MKAAEIKGFSDRPSLDKLERAIALHRESSIHSPRNILIAIVQLQPALLDGEKRFASP